MLGMPVKKLARIFCLGGVSGAGKTTVVKNLRQKYQSQIAFLPRYTTRPERNDDTREEIKHLLQEQFLHHFKNGALAGVHVSNREMYAISLDRLQQIREENYLWIGVVSMSAGCAVRSALPIRIIYLTVDNRQVLQQRLESRGMPGKEIDMRLGEYDATDMCYRQLANHIIFTDRESPDDTTGHVARLLEL
jgi:guanylate kinase